MSGVIIKNVLLANNSFNSDSILKFHEINSYIKVKVNKILLP